MTQNEIYLFRPRRFVVLLLPQGGCEWHPSEIPRFKRGAVDHLLGPPGDLTPTLEFKVLVYLCRQYQMDRDTIFGCEKRISLSPTLGCRVATFSACSGRFWIVMFLFCCVCVQTYLDVG